jgi:hypothetical protein
MGFQSDAGVYVSGEHPRSGVSIKSIRRIEQTMSVIDRNHNNYYDNCSSIISCCYFVVVIVEGIVLQVVVDIFVVIVAAMRLIGGVQRKK